MKTEGNNNNERLKHKETPIPAIDPWITLESIVQLSDGSRGMVVELNDQRNKGYRLLMNHNKQLEYHPLNESDRSTYSVFRSDPSFRSPFF